jgi:release factor glutamine methyltransferase
MMLQAVTLRNSEEHLREAAVMLRNAGVESARLEARLLLAHVLRVAPGELIARPVAVSANDSEVFFASVHRRCRREPLAYITGRREFWSLEFSVSPAVLIPRPESEVLVESALREFSRRNDPLRVLDLGTGSGCLLLAFLSERPGAQGLGVDLSESALRLAQENSQSLSLDGRAKFSCCDWGTGIEDVFDVVIANPPYLRTAELSQLEPELAYEPASALDGGMDGQNAYREIAERVRRLMKPDATLFLEIGKGQADAVQSIFLARGFRVSGTICDLAGIPRCVIVHG